MYDTYHLFSYPVIDIEKTSANLKAIRQRNNVSVAELQKIFAMENPQSIYNWENSTKKFLPRLDNLVVLARLYKTSIDDLIVLRHEQAESLSAGEPPAPPFFVGQDVLDFIRQNACPDTLRALEYQYGCTLS